MLTAKNACEPEETADVDFQKLARNEDVTNGNEKLLAALAQPKGSLDLLTKEVVPERWLRATNNNTDEAFSRWLECLKWRQENHIDQLLQKEQRNFDKIKATFKHCFVGRDKHGNLVTIEEFGSIKDVFRKLKKADIGPSEFGEHATFVTEYWMKQNLTATGKLVKIIDLKGLSMFFFTPMVASYFKVLAETFRNYPECLEAAYLVNVPTFFRLVWKFVTPFIDKNTLEKFHVVSGSTDKMRSLLCSRMDPNILPEKYGGTLRVDTNVNYSDLPIERRMADFVSRNSC